MVDNIIPSVKREEFCTALKNTCPLPTEYGLLVHELDRRAASKHQPINGTFELTNRCNLDCRMCYVRHPAHDASLRANELTAKAWLELAYQSVDNGMVFLLLTGGEVFLRPDFFDIYLPLTRMGLLLTLFTNGTLITDTIAQRLAETPPSRTEITLYGATAATYEAITGVQGSYARCCLGVDALVKHGVSLSLKTTLTKRNIPELDAMRQMASNWGLPFSEGWLLLKRRDGNLSAVEDLRLSAEVCVAIEGTDHAVVDDWVDTALLKSSPGIEDNFYCQAGKNSFAINPIGEMNPCHDLIEPAVRPLEIGFRAAWMQVQRFVDNAPPMSSVCSDCDARGYCQRCPAWSAMENGTLNEPVSYLCQIAFARKARYQPYEILKTRGDTQPLKRTREKAVHKSPC